MSHQFFKEDKKVSLKSENYRPVSLTSLCCKLMESIIKDQVVDHISSNKLMNSSNNRFMQNKSCTTNLLEFFEKVTEVVDSGEPGEPLDVIYLDFAKAFDKVPIMRLLDKIYAHGIQGKVLNWIKACLTGREQRTVINVSYSEWSQVESGVPQESVLGTIAFVWHIYK